MSNTRPNPIIRVFPSLTDVAFLMPIVFLFVRMEGAKTMLGDGDTGWHIRTGEWIMANGRVPDKDIFSFTKPGQTWYAWEWLWDVAFAWLYHHGGLAMVITASVLVLCLTFALLFRLIRRHCENDFLAAAATFLACAGSTLHWLARPHLFTLLFLVILLSILDRVQQGRIRMLFVLPLLTVLWTNLHGGFFIEFVILGGYVAGEIARALFTAEPEERSAALHRAKWYLVTAAVCAVATLINPYGYNLHRHIIQFFTEPYHFQNIAEYQSISFHEGAAIYLETTLLLSILSALWFLLRHRNFIPAVLLLGWAHLALFAARNVPLLAIVAAPYIAQALDESLRALRDVRMASWLNRAIGVFTETGAEFSVMDRVWRLHLISFAGVALLALLLTNPNATGKLKPEYDPARYPSKALATLRSYADSRIFADDEWGDYLIYQLYPGQKVFVDGRDDFYGQEFEQKYLDFITVKYDWEQYLHSFAIDTVVLSTKSAMASVMKESRNWRPVYDDTVAIIFRAVPDASPAKQVFSPRTTGRKDRDPRIANVPKRDLRITTNLKLNGV